MEQDDDYCLESKYERKRGRKKERKNRTITAAERKQILERGEKEESKCSSAVCLCPLFRIFPGFRHSLDFLPPIRLMTL